MMKNEASVTPLGVIALSSFLSNVNKKISRSLIKVLVCHYYFYVHKMCFWILFLLQHPFSFHYILRALGLELLAPITTALTGIPVSTPCPPRRVLARFPGWACPYSQGPVALSVTGHNLSKLLILRFRGLQIRAMRLLERVPASLLSLVLRTFLRIVEGRKSYNLQGLHLLEHLEWRLISKGWYHLALRL